MRRLVGLIASSAGPPSTTTPSLGSNPPRLFSTGAAQNKTMAASGSNPLLRLSPDTRLSPRCYNGSTSSLSSSWTSRSPFGLSRQPSVCSGQPLTVSFWNTNDVEKWWIFTFHFHFSLVIMAVKVHPLQPNWANIYLRRLLLVIQGKTLVQTIMTAKVRPEYPQEDLSSAWLRLMHLQPCSNSVQTPLTWDTTPWSPPPSPHHLSESLHPPLHPPNSF